MDKDLHILLAEDDAVSRSFLTEVLSAVATVVAMADGASALDRARRQRFDLLVLDQSLPGLKGSAVAMTLRAEPSAASTAARMVALSAGLDEAGKQTLCDSGFDAALAKPIDARTLLDQLDGPCGTQVKSNTATTTPVLDDAGAMRALGGNAGTMSRLRTLLAGELPVQLAAIAARFAAHDADAVIASLHRLQASCGFCGAAELAEASKRLSRHVRGGAFDDTQIKAFLQAAGRLQHALGAAVATGSDS